jgi:hypothetical protein
MQYGDYDFGVEERESKNKARRGKESPQSKPLQKARTITLCVFLDFS